MRKEFREISEWQKRPGARKRDGIFVVEGIRMCEEIPLERLYRTVMTESFCKAHRALAERLSKASGGLLGSLFCVKKAFWLLIGSLSCP